MVPRHVSGNDGYGLAMGLMRPCGRCNACRKRYAADKAIRMVHEQQFWPTASFLTLTYDERRLYYHTDQSIVPSITPRHLQLFFKRLRKRTRLDLSYVACGEYGTNTDRPHYHVILYGYDFSADRKFYDKTPTGNLYNSSLLDVCWQHQGHAVIADVSYDSCAYVAGYTIKKLNGKDGKSAYYDLGRLPPFGLMSRKPAIGKRWIQKHYLETVQHGDISINGKQRSIPRYYLDWIKSNHPKLHDKLVAMRRDKYEHLIVNNVANDIKLQTINANKMSKM